MTGPRSLQGGTPVPDGGYPSPRWGYPSPITGYPLGQRWGTPQRDGVLPRPASSRWSTLPTQPGMGYPPIGQQMEYLIRHGRYASCGFPQEDFLVKWQNIVKYRKKILHLYNHNRSIYFVFFYLLFFLFDLQLLPFFFDLQKGHPFGLELE